jgi:hypothetical protein
MGAHQASRGSCWSGRSLELIDSEDSTLAWMKCGRGFSVSYVLRQDTLGATTTLAGKLFRQSSYQPFLSPLGNVPWRAERRSMGPRTGGRSSWAKSTVDLIKIFV